MAKVEANRLNHFLIGLKKKTSIQMASKVRSYNGLMVHVFGRIAAAFLILIERVSIWSSIFELLPREKAQNNTAFNQF